MVRHIPCGTFVNESERIACERLRAKLQGVDGDWIILSNLNHAQHPALIIIPSYTCLSAWY